MYTAQTSALALPEILTSILSHVDMSTLLLSQRVCKSWCEVINKSPILQQCLFFTSSPPSNKNSPPILNPLLVDKFPAWFTTLKMGIYDMNAFEELEWCDGIRDENMNINLDFWNQNRNMEMRRSVSEKAYTYSKASWRNMLVVQPAAREILIDAETSSMGGVSGGEARIKVEAGVRMGMLFDYVWMVVAEPISGFGFDWRGVSGVKGDADGDVDGDWGGSGHGEIFKYLGSGWRGKGSEGIGNWDGRVRLMTRYTMRCCPGDVDALMQRVVSEGYRNWDVEWKMIEVQERHRPWGRTYLEGSGEWKVEEEKEEEGK